MAPLPIVLCSGQLLTRLFWAPLERHLGDRPIFHAATASDDSIAAMASRLLADAPPRFHLVAHAMGGFVAFEVLRRAPERVVSLTLMATLATADGPAQLARRQGYLDLVQSGAFEQVVEERLPLLLADGRREGPVAEIARRMADDTGAEAFLRQQRAIIGRIDSQPDLPAITLPVLILRGDADGIVGEDAVQTMARGISGSRAVTIADAGHLLLLEQPAAVLTPIVRHLAAAEAAR